MLWPAVAVAVAGGLYGCNGDHDHDDHAEQDSGNTVDKAVANIDNVVVIFAENRSFDNLYSEFPGQQDPLATATFEKQKDRDGKTELATLPPVWNGLTQPAASQFVAGLPTVTQADTEGMPNAPFSINEDYGVGLNAVTHDMWHQFYQNQMQINGGKNDMFVAWADAGGMVMGHFSGAEEQSLPLWNVAKKYTLADRFFQGAFGGSFLNHQYLIASAPLTVDPALAKYATSIAVLTDGDQGHQLEIAAARAGESALTAGAGGLFTRDGPVTPDGFAINTMQPAYQPSSVAPAADATGDALLLADPNAGNVVTPQTGPNIGDYLTQKNVDWAWYSGGWDYILGRTTPPNAYVGNDGGGVNPVTGVANANFQFHHQPFNYFARFDPATPEGAAERAAHLKDAGLEGERFVADIDAGKLPPVSFYKPVGNLNEHNGYADVLRGDQKIADIIAHLEKSPQWEHMLVVVTYDENGGIWDHIAPPKADRFGPGSRIPALIIGPTVKKNNVDHAVNDTTSILRFITRRWSLPVLPGLKNRNDGYKANGVTPGDLTEALEASAS